MFKVTLKEKRSFAPPQTFVQGATHSPREVRALRTQAKKSPTRYWAEAARELEWMTPFKTVLKGKSPDARWFVGGKLNASVNCLDRHVARDPHRTAILWEGEPGEVVAWTYRELHREVERLTAALRGLGLKKGDRVAIYMPMIPEAAAAMLACARGGFTHTVVFGGFSADSLKDRMIDSGARCLITADGGYRKGALFDLSTAAKAAVAAAACVEFVVSVERKRAGKLREDLGASSGPARGESHADAEGGSARWYRWHDLLASVTPEALKRQGAPEKLDSEHPLFILYTSGTTGKPKGLVHSTAGFLTGALRSFRLVFDYRSSDLYWCTADIGWITGHTYIVYGPLAAGATIFMYEGTPMHPGPDRFWRMIARHKVSIFYTAPTAIRSFMKLGAEAPRAHDLSSLRLLGTVGEPINPEAWMWYREVIGGGRCPIVDTYWQTETGSIVISPLPSETKTKPGSATKPLPGFDVAVLNKAGKPVKKGSGGYLVIRQPWPSMARTIFGDHVRFKKTYFSEFPELAQKTGRLYFTGDGARMDTDGDLWCLGRVDDVLNVSGHRIGTMEVESALVAHADVAEAAVVGRPDELKGQALVAYVTLKSETLRRIGQGPGAPAALQAVETTLKAHVAQAIGAIARPDDIRFSEALPKTRSGKIMRRLLRELATSGKVTGDTTTLEDFQAIAALHVGDEE